MTELTIRPEDIRDAIARGSAEPGYMIADYPRALNEGFLAIISDCERRLAELDEAEPEHLTRIDTLRSIIISCAATLRLAERHGDEARRLADRIVEIVPGCGVRRFQERVAGR